MKGGEAGKAKRPIFRDEHVSPPFPSLPASLQFSRPGPAACAEEAKTETPGKREPPVPPRGPRFWPPAAAAPSNPAGPRGIEPLPRHPRFARLSLSPALSWLSWGGKGQPLSCFSLEGTVPKLAARSRRVRDSAGELPDKERAASRVRTSSI